MSLNLSCFVVFAVIIKHYYGDSTVQRSSDYHNLIIISHPLPFPPAIRGHSLDSFLILSSYRENASWCAAALYCTISIRPRVWDEL